MAIWQEIVDAHGPLVWRLTTRLLGNEHDAADCYQTVFLEAFEALQRRPVENWPGFLTRLSTRRAIDLLRLRKRKSDFGLAHPPAEPPGPQRVLAGRESIALLRESLARLPADQVEVFCLRYFEQMSNQEIACRLSTNANRVGVLLHRARESLRTALGEDSRQVD